MDFQCLLPESSSLCFRNFLEDDKFKKSRQVLDSEMKRLSRTGLGSVTKKAQPFSEAEEEQLWASRQLGDFNPRVLLRTLLFMNGKNFGLRGGAEHRRLRFKPAQVSCIQRQTCTEYHTYHTLLGF